MAEDWMGWFPALWTPTDDAGRLLVDALDAQVKFLRSAGADGLMVLGSTGEFVHLDLTTRKAVLERVVKASGGGSVIANCSDVNPLRVADLGRFSRKAGARAISLLPPWFFPGAPVDIVEFLVRGAEAAGLPLIIYNFPERTGHRLSLETIAAVCDRVQVVALKQSGAEFEYHRQLAKMGGEKGFVLITGADTQIPEAFDLGARAVVSGLANAVPELVGSVVRALQTGDRRTAAADTLRLREFASALEGLDFPVDVAAAMRARGREAGVLKQVLSPETLGRFDRAVAENRERLRGWGLR